MSLLSKLNSIEITICVLLNLAIAAPLCLTAQSNFNLEFIANLDQHPEGYNDIWGYVAQDGTEYAILGCVAGTSIISLEDPANPIEVEFIPGGNSIWRDMKSWGDYAYVTTDASPDGLLIINMKEAPNNITWEFWTPDLPVGGNTQTLEGCHNLYIDENGYCYISGCATLGQGGVLIFDLNTTPGVPIFVGAQDDRYSHDVYVRGDTMWSSDVFDGFFSVYDISDKSTPELLATQSTSFNFTHNAWLSDDGNYLFTTDERPDAYVDAYDVSDLSDIRFLDSFRPKETENNGVIPHNTHYKDGFLVTSWYTDGLVIMDAHRPDNLIKVGHYDTYLGAHGGFSGCWGAYPWLPSGIILASDMNTGLYLFQPEYKRACYLEGKVTDAVTGSPINDATIEILSNEVNEEHTNPLGNYKTGQSEAGIFDVVCSHPNYPSKTVQATLINGEVTILDIELGETSTAYNNFNAPETEISIFPSLFDQQLNISYTLATKHYNNAQIIATDVAGKIIWENNISPKMNTGDLSIPTMNWIPGIYCFQLKVNGLITNTVKTVKVE
ncbi:MAG: choice-of-anchor B family protein [Chitinophagales bacterium]|nr:choice-of-anchor B family protein [Chitinophagales bacterium]